jgi:hypothetical protein
MDNYTTYNYVKTVADCFYIIEIILFIIYFVLVASCYIYEGFYGNGIIVMVWELMVTYRLVSFTFLCLLYREINMTSIYNGTYNGTYSQNGIANYYYL